MTTMDILEWTATILSIAGATLLAFKNRYSGWGFVLFLISNVLWISFAILINKNGFFTTQVAFTCTSLIGIYNWIIRRS